MQRSAELAGDQYSHSNQPAANDCYLVLDEAEVAPGSFLVCFQHHPCPVSKPHQNPPNVELEQSDQTYDLDRRPLSARVTATAVHGEVSHGAVSRSIGNASSHG